MLEIIELGISGSKSAPGRKGSGASTAGRGVLKGEKELNPASKRVLEAAEGALLWWVWLCRVAAVNSTVVGKEILFDFV